MSSYYYILDANGDPIEATRDEWFEWGGFLNKSCQLARTDISDDCYVSTVFLTMNHALDSDAPPILYETMILGGPLERERERFTTRSDALAAHERMVALARSRASFLRVVSRH